MELIMPYVGDDFLTVKEYKALREKYRQAQTTTPWKKWAAHYLSPAGKRDRDLAQRTEQAEATRQKAVSTGIRDQRRAMDEESRRAGLDPVRNDEVSRLMERANERDWETGGDYSVHARRAQDQLRAMGVQPGAGRVG